MSIERYFKSFADRLHSTANVQTLYGEPFELDGKSIIPVARVSYAFGGGPTSQGNADDLIATAGGGGAVNASPIGVLEVSPEGTRFIAISSWKKSAVLLAVGFGVGVLVGKLLPR